MSTFYEILEQIRKESKTQREKGTKFERLMRNYLKTSNRYATILQDVWLWKDFPYRRELGGIDTGVDIVARTFDGEYWAIQCKFYDENTVIDKGEVDTFITTAGRSFNADGKKMNFSQGVWFSTSDRWGKNAEEAIRNQNPPVDIVLINTLAYDSTVDWDKLNQDKFGKNASCRKVHKIEPYQQDALTKGHEYYKTHNRGKLIMACGTGKTFTSLRFVEQETKKKGLILFMVPSIALMNQTLTEWMNQTEAKITPICVCSDETVSKVKNDGDDVIMDAKEDLALPACTDAFSVAKQIYRARQNEGMTVVFSTYQSVAVVHDAQQMLMGKTPETDNLLMQFSSFKAADYSFNFIICDEAHRTTGAVVGGGKESHFVRIHDGNYVIGRNRIYMTATPRMFNAKAKEKAKAKEVYLWSMDDETIYGEEFYRFDFDEAVEKGKLSDYKVLILTVHGDTKLPTDMLEEVQSKDKPINTDDAIKMVGCINALSKRVVGDENGNDLVRSVDMPLMHKAVVFSDKIIHSKYLADAFNRFGASIHRQMSEEQKAETVLAKAKHVDGTMLASDRRDAMKWLKGAPEHDSTSNECRILCNVRCLSEGVDVPSLDAVIFMSQKNSEIDIVQSVGRVMRTAPGKKYGYIIIPVVVPTDADLNEIFNKDDSSYATIWRVLNALRAHDERALGRIGDIQILKNHSDLNGGGKREPKIVVGSGEKDGTYFADDGSMVLFDDKIRDALCAKLVIKMGTKRYWTEWAQDVAKIAERHIERINNAIVTDLNYAAGFNMLMEGLHKNINPTIAKDEAIEMLAQHFITRPVFDALFENYEFTQSNPISKAIKGLLDLMDENAFEKDIEVLGKFYKSVRKRCSSVTCASEKQKVILELYDTFFKTAMPTIVEKLGIVYTPVEVVDFINQSVADVLKKEFKRDISDANVHIIDPFTGTGTFITRMIESGLIKPEDLPRKYANELHANELVLLAYYIASINIENAYHDAVQQKQGEYTPFEGICLTDTFQLYEDKDKNVDTLKFTEVFPKNSKRVVSQMKQPIQVIVGNPPYSVGQRSANDNAQNNSYPKLEERIANTYVAGTNATNKNSVYDSYVKAFRWASDRLDATNGGIIGFVTNGGWLDGSALNGMRKCFEEEFTSVYVYNLRGNQRTSGETSRCEGGKIFGSGSRAPIAVTILVRNPKAKTDKATIYYHDIGDYLTREQKLANISKMKSVLAKNFTQKVLQSDEHGDWFNQRSNTFGNYIPLGDKDNKHNLETFFVPYYSNGLKTQRDIWCYSFSLTELKRNIKESIDFYNSECERLTKSEKADINYDTTKFSWTRATVNDVRKGKKYRFINGKIVESIYRPFCKENLFFYKSLNEMVYQIPKLYPSDGIDNLVICLCGISGTKEYSVLIANKIPDLHFNGDTQCFPLYWYEENIPKSGQMSVFDIQDEKDRCVRHDGITDWIWEQAKKKYGNEVTKEDIFYYVYGLLHCPEYRTQFAADLKKMLPRLPLLDKKEDFVAFNKAGRQLADLHLNYENRKPPKCVKVDMTKENYIVDKMRFADKKDKSIIKYNKDILIKGIPLEAYEYVVNGRSAIEWIMERYQVKTDKDSGITNDPNDWAKEHNQPRYILDLLLSIITVSMETMKIVKSLPEVRFE